MAGETYWLGIGDIHDDVATVDYATLRRPDLSEPLDGEAGPKVALVAARLGATRLIDNLEF